MPIFYSGRTQQLQAGFSLLPYRGSSYKGSTSLTLVRKRNANAVNDHVIAPQWRDVTSYEFYAFHRDYLGQAV